MRLTEYPQIANNVDFKVEDEFLWRPFPNIWVYAVHPDGAVQRWAFMHSECQDCAKKVQKALDTLDGGNG